MITKIIKNVNIRN